MNACDFKITNHNPNHKSIIQGSSLTKTDKNRIRKQDMRITLQEEPMKRHKDTTKEKAFSLFLLPGCVSPPLRTRPSLTKIPFLQASTNSFFANFH